jgi:anti-sigma regulatory factor (Ser/Thr protein kinase)
LRILQFHTDSDPGSLGRARRRVRNTLIQAGFGDVADRVEVAVGEALTNVYEHAYGAGVGPVSVTVFRTAESLMVSVSDNGRATVPPSVPPVPPCTTVTGGRGLYLVGRLMDDVAISVNPAGYGLTLRMTMHLTPRGEAA